MGGQRGQGIGRERARCRQEILTRERKKRAIEGEKKNRRAEERTKEEGGKEEGRGNARGGEEKASRKGERGRRRR